MASAHLGHPARTSSWNWLSPWPQAIINTHQNAQPQGSWCSTEFPAAHSSPGHWCNCMIPHAAAASHHPGFQRSEQQIGAPVHPGHPRGGDGSSRGQAWPGGSSTHQRMGGRKRQYKAGRKAPPSCPDHPGLSCVYPGRREAFPNNSFHVPQIRGFSRREVLQKQSEAKGTLSSKLLLPLVISFSLVSALVGPVD